LDGCRHTEAFWLNSRTLHHFVLTCTSPINAFGKTTEK
jgi:hypothetical protein